MSAKSLREKYKDENGKSLGKDTWCRWLAPIRDIVPPYTKVYNPKQLEAIYNLIGNPDKNETENSN